MNDLDLCLDIVQGHVNHCVTFDRSTLNISETVTDKGFVPKDRQYEMAYGVSNGHVTDDVTWPQKGAVRQYGRLS